MSHAALNPARAVADVTRLYLKNPLNPWTHTSFGKTMAASAEMFERFTRRYGKPEWGIHETVVGGERVPVHITPVWERAVLPPPAFRARVSRASAPAAAKAGDRRADVGPLRDAARAARSRPSSRTTMSTSPNGSTRVWCRCSKAASISTITSITSFRSCMRWVVIAMSSAVCQPAVPVLAAVAAHGSREAILTFPIP